MSAATAATNSSQTLLTAGTITSDTITLNYIGMPGNQPNTYGNLVAIWENAGSIPWNASPLATMPIPNNSSAGAVTFDGLDTNSKNYIAGYSVGSMITGGIQPYGNICSTAYLPAASAGADTYFQSSVSDIWPTSASVSFTFTFPDGLLPMSNGAWAGLWQAARPNLYSMPPLAAISINLDASQGTAAFNNVYLLRGMSYTIALFMSGWKSGGGSKQTVLACSAGFTT